MSEREPKKKLDEIDENEKRGFELDSKFVDLMEEVTKGIRNTGALVALGRLQKTHTQLDWSNFPQGEGLQAKINKDRKKADQLVSQAVDNRAEALIVRHTVSVERDGLVISVEEALGQLDS